MRRTCCECGAVFEPTGNGYRCHPCRLAYDKGWRAKRKAEGRPVISSKMPRDWHREYEVKYRQRPEVRERLAQRARDRRNNPAERHKHEARWMLNRALAAGRLEREPCEQCGTSPTDAHHDDYSKPLNVRWLCRPCHTAEHAKAEARAEGKTTP